MANINTIATKNKFGVPVVNGTGSGILMPKLQYRFRVSFLNFGGTDAKVLTQNVNSVKRPQLTFQEVAIDSYNSKVYVQGKHEWSDTNVVVRDDISNSVSKLVGRQLQRQLNHFQQTTPAVASDFKFDMHIEVLDGTNQGETEVWYLEGCFLKDVDYSEGNYTTNDPVTITMSIRYDNATHYQGSNDIDGRLEGGNPFPYITPLLNQLGIEA
jgi:hypothetical protein